MNALLRPAWLGFLQGAVLSVAMNLLTGANDPPAEEIAAIALLVLSAVALVLVMIFVENAETVERNSRSAQSRRRPFTMLVVALVLAVAGFVAHGLA